MSRGLERALGWIRSRVESLEEIPVGPAGWAAGFLSIVAVRHLLELRSSGYPLYPPSAFYLHYLLAYLAPLLALSLVLVLFSGVQPERVLRLMLLAWGLTLLPPLVDALVARPHEARIGYMELGETPWSTVFLHFFDPGYPLGGTTPGIRVEALVACLLGALYVVLRAPRARIARAIGAVLAIYATSLFFFTAPFLFVRALRAAFPGLTTTQFFHATGRVIRPESIDVRIDQSVLVYLIPLTLLLGAATLALARPSWLARASHAFLSREALSWPVCVAIGSYAAWKVLDGVPRPAELSPFDPLALVAAPLALLLGGAGLSLLAPRAPEGLVERSDGSADPLEAIGLVTLTGAALLATTVSSASAAYGAIALGGGVLARGTDRVLPWAVLAPQTAFGISTVGAFLAGYALMAGDEAHTLFPSAWFLLLFLVGFLADLPRATWLRDLRLGFVSKAVAAAAPFAPLVVSVATVHARLAPVWIVLALIASAGVLLIATTPRTSLTTGAAVFGAALVMGAVIADPALSLAWREKALDSPTYYMRLSERAEQAGDLTQAAGAAAEAVRRAPALAAAHQRLGLVRQKAGDLTGSADAFRTAVSLAPRDAELRGSLAAVLLPDGKVQEALETVTAAAAIDPRLPRLQFIRAQCLDALGRRDEATSAWRDYIALAVSLPDEAPYVELARRRLAAGAP